MRRLRRIILHPRFDWYVDGALIAPILSLLLVGALAAGCRHAPPTLSPAAATAWKQHEAQKDLDLLRDVAIDANAQVPPLLSESTTRKIVTYHRSAITLIHDAPQGWKVEVLTGLDELQRVIPPTEYQVIAKYVALARTVLQEVQ